MLRTLLTVLFLAFLAGAAVAQEAEAPLVITTEKALPKAILGANYETKLTATGGVSPWTWDFIAGKFPPGLNLDSSGTISGTPTTIGQFRFALEVSDSDDPPDARTREFTLNVISALVVEWNKSPVVTATGIEGSVKLINQTADNFDLTMIVVAVNDIGKAFVLGYQHFVFSADSTISEIPFGAALPQGDYIVHADVISEVAEKDTIHRVRLQTSEPLTTH